MSKLIDLTGMRFGRLTVLYRADNRLQPGGSSKTMWRCRCDCGNFKDIWSHALIANATTSCGCVRKEIITQRNTTHGYSKTRLGRIWFGMKTRCNNPNFPAYKNYGGRGIKICDEWINNPENFYSWAMANGYSDNLTLDRIDVNADYSPDNCRWVTWKVQSNNKRNCILLTYNGQTHTMAEWARICGIPYQTLKDRIRRYGWSVEEALTKVVS